MATSKYPPTEETTNASRVSRVLLGPCTDQMRDVLRHRVPPHTFPQVIHQHRLKLPKLTKPQMDLILPRSGHYSGNYSDFDISLLYTLLRNICNIPPHTKGWGKDPDPNDVSLSANIENIRITRNKAYGHVLNPSLSNSDFNDIWSKVRSSVVEIDTFLNNNQTYAKAVDFLRNVTMDPEMAKQYEEKLRDQVKEDTETRKMITETTQMVQEHENKIEQLQVGVKRRLEEDEEKKAKVARIDTKVQEHDTQIQKISQRLNGNLKDHKAKFEEFKTDSTYRQDRTETDIQKHDADILHIKQQTYEHTARQDKTETEIQRHDAEIHHIRQQTDEYTARQDKTETEIQRHDAEILHIRQQTDEHTAKQDKTETEIQRHDAEILHIRQQTDEHTARQDKTETEIQRHDAEILHIRQQTDEHTARQDKTETEIQRHDAEILHIRQQTDEHTAKHDKTETEIQRHDAEILHIRQQTDEHTAKQDKTETEIQKHDAEILHIRQQTDEHTAKHDKTETEIQRHDEEILYIRKQIDDDKSVTASIQEQQTKLEQMGITNRTRQDIMKADIQRHDTEIVNLRQQIEVKQSVPDEITWRSYPIDSFPAVSYLHGIMLDFCERWTNAAKTMSLDINAHPRYNKVNIGFVGRPERKLMRLVSKKTGQACDEIEDEDVYNTSLHIPLPFILVCFLKENETISCCVEGKCSIEQQFESLLKSPVRTLIVHQNADLSFSNQQTHLVVSNQKDEVRQGLASLVEETMFGKFEEYEKDIDRDSYSLLQEFSAIRRLQEPMDLAISTDISTKRKVPPEIIQLLSKYDDIVAFGVWNTDFRILTKKSISAYQKNNICKQLEETDKSFYTSCKPSFYIIINEEIYCPYAIQQGAKITEHGNSVKKRTSGTLGGIAIGSNQKLYGLTCSHVLPQIDSAVYMSDGLGNSIGQCIFSNASGPKSMCDFAVFEVDGHIVSNCIRSLVDEKNKERKASLCKFDLSSLSGKFVHKKGASTEWTKGIIACAELHERFSCGRTDSKELMVFEGFNKTQFADRGDSGSLVIAHDLRNNRNNLLVLGMVSGGELELREDNSSANTQNLTSYSLGFYLNHAIDLFQKKFSNIDLHFDNDVKSSSSESDSE